MKRTRFGIFWATVLLALLAAAPAATGQPYDLAPIYPTDGEVDVPMLPNFQCTGETSTSGAQLIYKVYLDTNMDDAADIVHKVWPPVDPGEIAAWQLPMKYALAPDTDYQWRIQAKDTVTQEKTLSDWWSFHTGAYPYIASVAPESARPTDLVWLTGSNFGDKQGAAKIIYVAIVGYTEAREPIYKRWPRPVDGDFGRIVGWTDTEVVIQLAHPIWWTNLPQIVKIKVRPAKPSEGLRPPWTNKAKLRVEWGGGGWTGMVQPSGW